MLHTVHVYAAYEVRRLIQWAELFEDCAPENWNTASGKRSLICFQ